MPGFPLRLIGLQGIFRISFLLHQLIISQLSPTSNSKSVLLFPLMNVFGNIICFLFKIIIRIELIYSIMLLGVSLYWYFVVSVTALGVG